MNLLHMKYAVEVARLDNDFITSLCNARRKFLK